jgi:GST-like protein
MAVWPWYGVLTTGKLYTGEGFNAAEFLSTHEYTNVIRWFDEIAKRPAVIRGRMVNRMAGPLEEQLHERHDASDFDTKTQDKLQPEA